MNETHLHPLRTTIVMAAWPVSGDSSQVQAFLRDQLSSSSIRGGQAPINSTLRPSQHSLAGVVQGQLIRFKQLCLM